MDIKIDLGKQPGEPVGKTSFEWLRRLIRTRQYILTLPWNQRKQFIKSLNFCDGCGAYRHDEECECE